MKSPQFVLLAALVLNCATSNAQQVGEWTAKQVRVAVQKICPVSGQELGAHGKPIKAKIGAEEVFLCCQSCVGKNVKSEHWGTIHKNFAAAQQTCTVMGHELPKKPEWTIIDGQIFYVCCPPCKEKIAADPAKYAVELMKRYRTSLATSLE